MANPNIPWSKILPFFGVGLAVFFAFVSGGSAGILFKDGEGLNAVVSIVNTLAWLALAVFIYKAYQKEKEK